MTTLKQRFATLANARPEISQADLARATGAKPPSVHAWFSGETKSMKAETAAKAAALYGCSPMWLATGTGEAWVLRVPLSSVIDSGQQAQPAADPARYPIHSQPEEGYVRLPVMAEASAGPGREALPEVVNYMDVLESYVRRQLGANPKNIKLLTARGSSMTGQIEDGDVMFVEPTEEFTDDGLYVLTLDHLVRVKRLSISTLSQQVVIESNDGRKAETLPLKEVPHRLRIQGRVVGTWSLRRFS